MADDLGRVSKKKLWLWMIPGLIPVLVRPSWSAWVGSVLLSACFQAALISTFLWPELLSYEQRLALWAFLGGGWLMAPVASWQALRVEKNRLQRRQTQDAFPQALRFYLRGERSQAELVLRQLLHEDPCDIEAALLLASVWRRQGRLEAAHTLLCNLGKLDAAWPWAFEIRREVEILMREREVVPGRDAPSEERGRPSSARGESARPGTCTAQRPRLESEQERVRGASEKAGEAGSRTTGSVQAGVRPAKAA